MKIYTNNPAGLRRRAWVDIAVPIQPPEITRWRFVDRGWPVVRGIDIGKHTTMLHMFGQWRPLEEIQGDIQPVTNPTPLPFQPTDWVGDKPIDLFPFVTYRRPGEQGRQGNLLQQQLNLVEENEARQVWHIRGRIEDTMLVHDAYAYIYSGEDCVRLEGTLTNSDPSTDKMTEEFQTLAIRTGENFQTTWRDHFGFYIPWRSPAPNLDWHQLVILQKDFDDAQQIPYRGFLLCLPTTPSTLDPFYESTMLRLDSLRAYIRLHRGSVSDQEGGPVWGISEFGDKWLAFGKTPDRPNSVGNPMAAFRQLLRDQRDLYDARPLNLAKSAGQTGDQEDFGATGGAAPLVLNEPRLIEELLYNINEHFRPFHNRQPNGDPITKESNPKLWTWSQLPIGTTSPGPADDLGKGFNGVWPPVHRGTNYSGIDDQHRSQNVFNAAYALTGSYTLKSILLDFFEIDRTQVPGRVGAPRAIGRLFQSWANMLLLLPPEKVTTLEEHVKTRMEVVLRHWFGANVPEERPIRVIGTASSPATLQDSEGNPVEAWVVWEHAIAVMGFYAMHKVTGGVQSDLYKWAATHFSQLVASFGNFFDGVSWRCCTAVRYRRGSDEGNPVEDYSVGSFDIRIGDGFWRWVLPAIKICQRLTQDTSLKQRCADIILQVEGKGPQNWNESEWWAV